MSDITRTWREFHTRISLAYIFISRHVTYCGEQFENTLFCIVQYM